jgi:phosphomannomutase
MNGDHALSCFKAYDIRGRIPDQLNEELAYRIGRAYAIFLNPRQVAVGHDVRLSSLALSKALTEGLLDGGVEVLDIVCAALRKSTSRRFITSWTAEL